MKKPSMPYEIAPDQKKDHIRSLDGLRGVAVLLVVLFHDFDYLPAFSFGWIGVDIFFVLSGLLITTTFLKNMTAPSPVGLFYAKRLLRIFPLYYLSLILLLFILPFFVRDPLFLPAPGETFWFLLFLQNWMYILKASSSIHAITLRHFWSLALEEQYYLIWPWLLILIKRPKSLIGILIGMMGIMLVSRLIVWETANKEFVYYYFLCTRIEGLCIGSLLAIAFFFGLSDIPKKLAIALGITLVACLLLQLLRRIDIVNLPFFGLGGYLLISLAIALLICYVTKQGRTTILSNKMLVLSGKISYGWYVFHWPVYVLLSKPVGNALCRLIGYTPAKENMPFMPCRIISSVICILAAGLLAYISYYNFEIYFLRWKNRLRQNGHL